MATKRISTKAGQARANGLVAQSTKQPPRLPRQKDNAPPLIATSPDGASPGIPARHLAQAAQQRSPIAPPPTWWKKTLPKLLRNWGAFGAYLGHKSVAEQRLPILCLVVQTEYKRDLQVGAAIKPVPKHVRWKDGSGRYAIVTDVVQNANVIERQAGPVFGPGDLMRLGHSIATIGAVVAHPQAGRCLLTAGHAIPPGTPVGTVVEAWASNVFLQTKLLGYAQQGSTDFALLGPTQVASLHNLVKDYWRIGPAYSALVQDVGSTVYAVRQDGQMHATTVRGVSQFITAPNGIVYANLILVDLVTTGGDSGGALVDQYGRVWGFLIGIAQNIYSVFAPAPALLHSAGVQLA